MNLLKITETPEYLDATDGVAAVDFHSFKNGVTASPKIINTKIIRGLEKLHQ